ncbi:MAG TPA: hypothetical protein PL185_07270 [Flavobacteriales bacterium]|nr:hypothetical protein [Flavobacteriales bacterium]
MIRLFGLLSCLLALFLLPLNLRLLSDAVGMSSNSSLSGSCSGSWILFALLSLTTLLSAFAGIKVIRKA